MPMHLGGRIRGGINKRDSDKTRIRDMHHAILYIFTIGQEFDTETTQNAGPYKRDSLPARLGIG